MSYSDGGIYGKDFHISLFDGILILDTDGKMKDYTSSSSVSGSSAGRIKSGISGSSSKKTCTLCYGSGEHRCSTCGGSGRINEIKWSTDYGAGATPYDASRRCSVCGGDGYIECIGCGK